MKSMANHQWNQYAGRIFGILRRFEKASMHFSIFTPKKHPAKYPEISSPAENTALAAKTLAFPIARRPLRGRRAIFF
jgi:hypothetical protein